MRCCMKRRVQFVDKYSSKEVTLSSGQLKKMKAGKLGGIVTMNAVHLVVTSIPQCLQEDELTNFCARTVDFSKTYDFEVVV